MKHIPTLETERLTLRPFRMDDAEAVTMYLQDKDISDTTTIPWPYTIDHAKTWIKSQPQEFIDEASIILAICKKGEDNIIGTVGLYIRRYDDLGILGYWLGKSEWNKGFVTEASAALIEYAFKHLDIHKVTANYLTRNPASERVMQKLGMSKEGVFVEHTKKWGQYEDLGYYGIINPYK